MSANRTSGESIYSTGNTSYDEEGIHTVRKDLCVGNNSYGGEQTPILRVLMRTHIR